MKLCEVIGCMQMGQKHHIVFRSQGGLDIDVNFKYLCPEHHTGKESPHQDREIDLEFKREMQEKLYWLFREEEYTVDEIVRILGRDGNKIKRKFKKIRNRGGEYGRDEIVRAIMGGRIY